MIKTIAVAILSSVGISIMTGCEDYPHHRHDEVIVEPAGYRYDGHRDRDWDRHDHWDRDHWDRDRWDGDRDHW